MLDRYYDVVGVLSEQGSLSIIGPPGKDSRSETFLRLVEQAVVVPISLKGGNGMMQPEQNIPTFRTMSTCSSAQRNVDLTIRTEFVPGSYRALALSYLTRPDLGLVERQDDGQWTSEAFYQSVDVGRLSAAITEAYNTNEVALLKRDARLWLLCHYVDLHKSAFQRVQSPFYLECLYLQLSSLSSTIREVMVESATTGDDESSKAKKTGASSYVLRQLNSLAHKECLTLLLSGFSS